LFDSSVRLIDWDSKPTGKQHDWHNHCHITTSIYYLWHSEIKLQTHSQLGNSDSVAQVNTEISRNEHTTDRHLIIRA